MALTPLSRMIERKRPGMEARLAETELSADTCSVLIAALEGSFGEQVFVEETTVDLLFEHLVTVSATLTDGTRRYGLDVHLGMLATAFLHGLLHDDELRGASAVDLISACSEALDRLHSVRPTLEAGLEHHGMPEHLNTLLAACLIRITADPLLRSGSAHSVRTACEEVLEQFVQDPPVSD